MKFFAFFFTSIILFFSDCLLAQSDCPDNFNDISERCISSINKEFVESPIEISKLKPNTIFFYKTTTGELGKLIILSVIHETKKECTVYLDGITYSKDQKGFKTKSSLAISPEKNYWLLDRIYLNSDGNSSLVLEKISAKELAQRQTELVDDKSIKQNDSKEDKSGKEDKCYIIPSPGTSYVVFKKGKDETFTVGDSGLKRLYGSLILIFLSIFILVQVFIEDQDKFKTQEALSEAENFTKSRNYPFFLRITKPFYKRYFLPIANSSKNKQTFKNRYRQKIANAGLLKEFSPEDFMALKLFMIFGGPFTFLFLRYLLESDWPLYLTPIMAVIGYFYPNIWLSGMITNRGNQIRSSMPFIVDMLALSVEAGLDFMAAIQRVIEKAPPGPLVEEFETLIKETKIGSSRAEGLRQLGWRVNIIEINSFCATLIAADSVGASIGPLLKQLSAEIRTKRSARAEQLGATAATKILIPMIFFILPAVIVAIFSPMLLKFMSGKL